MQVTGKVIRSENRNHAKRRKVVKGSALSVVASASGDGRVPYPLAVSITAATRLIYEHQGIIFCQENDSFKIVWSAK